MIEKILTLSNSRYFQVLLYKTYADLIAESKRYYLSFLWWIVEPALELGTYYLVFGIFFKRETEHYVPFLFVGILLWRWFHSSVSAGGNSILMNKGLMNQVHLPKVIFPTVVILTSTVKFVFAFIIFFIFFRIYGLPVGWAYLSLPVLFAVQFVLIMAVAYLIAAFMPFFPDLKIIIDNVLRILLFLSGVFFAISSVSPKYQFFLRLNPMAILIEQSRNVLLENQWPDFIALLYVLIFGLLMLWISYSLLRRYCRLYPKVI